MNYILNSEIKPLSANLKRLEIGFLMCSKEFSFELEEFDLDDIWNHSKKIKSAEKKFDFIDSEESTEILIISLNEIFSDYNKNSFLGQDKSYLQDEFNDLILTALLFCINQTSFDKDFSKTINALKQLDIIEEDTIKRLESEIVSRKKVLQLNQNITNEIIKVNKFFKKPIKGSDNNEKKYQIFISSTFTDLKEERQAAVQAILKKGHIPAGMELFTAGDKSQWEVIKEWIDDSDIYLLILGGRYGSIDKSTGFSYTEMEYNYAIEKGKPFFALSLTDEILDKKPIEIIKDFDLKNSKYIAFKEKIKTKMCSFPNNIDQLKNEINYSLDNLISKNKNKMQGWIKGNI